MLKLMVGFDWYLNQEEAIKKAGEGEMWSDRRGLGMIRNRHIYCIIHSTSHLSFFLAQLFSCYDFCSPSCITSNVAMYLC
jgi:hypothetical protein